MTEPALWRVTAEYLTYEQARMAMDLIRNTMPHLYVFDACNRDGEPVWHEQGDLHYRPERDR